MASERVVVGSVGDDMTSRSTARHLRDAGHEVVFVGGLQTPEQLVRTALAEDASRLVVDADEGTLRVVRRLCVELGAGDICVDPAV